VRRSLWAVELPDIDEARCGRPALPQTQLFGALASHAACQAAARSLRDAGATEIEVRGAALLPGAARGWQADPLLRPATTARHGRVWVLYGDCAAWGWPVVDGGAPPAAVLPLVRAL